MKVLVISGTPKKEGLCDSFVSTAHAAASEAGASSEIIRLADMKLKKCEMCGDGWGICFGEHKCLHGDEDGFNELQIKIKKADAFVYVSPVYWGEISEDFKIFLDKLRRCQATKQWDERDKEISFLENKPSIIVVSAGGGGGGIVNTLNEMDRAISHMHGASWSGQNAGVFDYIAVNRWNQDYKRNALRAAVIHMVKLNKDK
jgi:multimeric flavodoxin WrbA